MNDEKMGFDLLFGATLGMGVHHFRSNKIQFDKRIQSGGAMECRREQAHDECAASHMN